MSEYVTVDDSLRRDHSPAYSSSSEGASFGAVVETTDSKFPEVVSRRSKQQVGKAAQSADDEDEEKWLTTGSDWLGKRVVRMFGGQRFIGLVVSWLPPNDEGDPPLWKVKHDDGDEEDLEEHELKNAHAMLGTVERAKHTAASQDEEKWLTTGSDWLGKRVVRMFGGQRFIGLVVSWLPPNDEGDPPLWKVKHDDGDEEDLEEHELKNAHAMLGTVERAKHTAASQDEEKWLTTGSDWLGKRVVRMFGGQRFIGLVVSWLPPNDEGDPPLWKVKHDDGDEEDLEEHELKNAHAMLGTVERAKHTAASRPVLKVGDPVQAFMGATGPYNAVVAEVHDGGAEYTLDWEDDDPNGRRQPAVNITARPDFANTRKSAASQFTHLSPGLKAAKHAERDVQALLADVNEDEAKKRGLPPSPARKQSKRIKKMVKKGKIVADFSIQGLEKFEWEKEQKEREKERQKQQMEKARKRQQKQNVAKFEPKKVAGPANIADQPSGEGRGQDTAAQMTRKRATAKKKGSKQANGFRGSATSARAQVGAGARAARAAAAVAAFTQKWGDPADWQFCACKNASCTGWDCEQGEARNADWAANEWAFVVDRDVAADDEATPDKTLRAENARLRAENARLRAELVAYAVDVVDLTVDDDVGQLAQPSDATVADDGGAAVNGAGVKRNVEMAQLHQRLTTVKREKHCAMEEADEHQELAKELALTVDFRQSFEDELQKQLRQVGVRPISWQEFRDGARA